MIADDIKLTRRGPRVELSALVRRDGAEEPFLLWYRFPAASVRKIKADGTPFLAALMMLAMALNEPLRIEAPVSAQLLRQSEWLMHIYNAWWPELAIVQIEAPRKDRVRKGWRRRPSATFFTLGVDSFYTLLKNSDGRTWGTPPISSLLYVVGFDVRSHQESLLGEIETNLQRAAESTGTEVLEIETNLRELTDSIVAWPKCHGAALASVAIALEDTFEAIYLAASLSFDDLFPWGSHPLTDELWATENMRYIHDGCELRRSDKIGRIADVPVVQATLRTCWENRGGRYNCGECEKCLRTMAALEGLDALGSTRTFPDSFPLDALDEIQWTPKVCVRFGKVLDGLPADERCDPLREALLKHTRPFDELKPHDAEAPGPE